jgi:NADH-quinone oxidoreductase subunit I
MNIFRKSIDALMGLLSGMALTFYYFIRLDKVITQQYPENRDSLTMFPRYKGKISLIKNEATGLYNCTACGLCARACPNNSITVERDKDPQTKKPRLVRFIYNFDRCTLCGLCIEACKFNALKMSQEFETAVYDKSELVQILNKDRIPNSLVNEPAQDSSGVLTTGVKSTPQAKGEL